MTITTAPGDPNDFENRFASLEQASKALSVDVQTMTAMLRVVGDLQKEQAEQRRRQDEADRALLEAKAATDAREARTRRTFGGVALTLSVILPLVSIMVYWSLIQHVDDLLAAQKASFYNSCQTRNEATRANAKREALLAEADKDKAVEQIHRDSVVALNKAIVDCSVYLVKDK